MPPAVIAAGATLGAGVLGFMGQKSAAEQNAAAQAQALEFAKQQAAAEQAWKQEQLQLAIQQANIRAKQLQPYFNARNAIMGKYGINTSSAGAPQIAVPSMPAPAMPTASGPMPGGVGPSLGLGLGTAALGALGAYMLNRPTAPTGNPANLNATVAPSTAVANFYPETGMGIPNAGPQYTPPAPVQPLLDDWSNWQSLGLPNTGGQ